MASAFQCYAFQGNGTFQQQCEAIIRRVIDAFVVEGDVRVFVVYGDPRVYVV